MRNGMAVVTLLAAMAAWAQARDSSPSPREAPPPQQEEEQRPDGAKPGDVPQRPSEEEMFGGEKPAPPAQKEKGEETRESPKDEEAERLTPGIRDRFAGDEAVEDPLDIGGVFYQRLFATNRERASFDDTTLNAPTLVDAYLDARPNDRLRALVSARMRYDPTLGTGAQTPRPGDAARNEEVATGSTSASLFSLLGQPAANPSVSLDQAWLRFDVLRTVFVTAGKQHVKWGAARFWNPTDFLNPVRRDPLALFDERTGSNMVKLHVPIEQTGMNFYAIGLLDIFETADALGKVGGALRAEIVLGNGELGLEAVAQGTQRPRYGLDFSSALGPLDVYVEAALRAGPYSRWVGGPTGALSPTGMPIYTFVREQQGDTTWAATGGLNWTFAYTDTDTATIGVEYFYNPAGYDDPAVYPWLLFNGDFQPFYVGRQYAGVYALLSSPGSWDRVNFIFSTLGNVADRSFVSRLDFTVRVLSYLTIEANASAFYGEPSGEFRLELNVPSSVVNGVSIPAISVPAQRFQLGLGLRMDI